MIFSSKTYSFIPACFFHNVSHVLRIFLSIFAIPGMRILIKLSYRKYCSVVNSYYLTYGNLFFCWLFSQPPPPYAPLPYSASDKKNV